MAIFSLVFIKKISMRILILTSLFLSTFLISCTWVSNFYIINKSSNKIEVTYLFEPNSPDTAENAISKDLRFNYVLANGNNSINYNTIEDIDIIGDYYHQEYYKRMLRDKILYSITLEPNTAIHCGRNQFHFSFSQVERRDQMFNNIIEMTIIRYDTNDTVTLKPSMISDFSHPLGKYHFALIFD